MASLRSSADPEQVIKRNAEGGEFTPHHREGPHVNTYPNQNSPSLGSLLSLDRLANVLDGDIDTLEMDGLPETPPFTFSTESGLTREMAVNILYNVKKWRVEYSFAHNLGTYLGDFVVPSNARYVEGSVADISPDPDQRGKSVMSVRANSGNVEIQIGVVSTFSFPENQEFYDHESGLWFPWILLSANGIKQVVTPPFSFVDFSPLGVLPPTVTQWIEAPEDFTILGKPLVVGVEDDAGLQSGDFLHISAEEYWTADQWVTE